MKKEKSIECCDNCEYFGDKTENGNTFGEMATGFCDHHESTKTCDGWCRFWKESEGEG
jgi:hypothetical protein